MILTIRARSVLFVFLSGVKMNIVGRNMNKKCAFQLIDFQRKVGDHFHVIHTYGIGTIFKKNIFLRFTQMY